MPHHETRKCPRCGKPFECKVGHIAACQCSAVSLTHEERAFIENRYLDCLCSNCLQSMKFEHKLYKHHIKH